MLAPMPSGVPQRIVYAGTPQIAVGPLRAIHAAGFDVVAVLTGVDKRRGRGSETTPSPVKSAALGLGIPVIHDINRVKDFAAPDTLGVVVAYGSLIPSSVLGVVPMINAHYSLLPRWRGAAPVERAILAGDTKTGVCVMRVVEELDTGEVFARQEIALGPTDTADDLRSRLDRVACTLLVETLRHGDWVGDPQVGEVVYARKITAVDRAITCDDARVEARRIRIGGAFVTIAGQRLRIVEGSASQGSCARGTVSLRDGRVVIGCATGVILCERVQPEGKAQMSALDWWRGKRGADTLVVDDV
ncbi:MAG: methionyl-tRNA formyltransferase [Ilumatobacteraceae bacterium]